MILAAHIGLVIAALVAIARLLIGPTLADRVIALDVVLVCLMIAITIDAAERGDTTWLLLLAVIAIIGFAATVAVSRFMEHDTAEEVGPRTRSPPSVRCSPSRSCWSLRSG